MPTDWKTSSQPDNLVELTMPRNVHYCIIALLRFLQALQPSFQEAAWAVQATIARAPGQWFALKEGDRTTGYIQASTQQGRYSSSPPETVDPGTILPLAMPTPRPFALRDFLAAMIDRLAIDDPAKGRDFLPYRTALIEPEARAGYLAMRRMVGAIAAGEGLQISEAAVMREHETTLLEEHDRLRLCGEIVGPLLLLGRIAQRAEPARPLSVALKSLPKEPVGDMRGFLDFVLSGIITQPAGAGWIRDAAQALTDRVEETLDEASRARSIGDFYGAIYSSIAFAYGSKRGFGFLAQSSAVGDERSRYAILRNQSDERVAHGVAALKVDFGNSMDQRFIAGHRLMVAKEGLKGALQAEAMTIELIDMTMTYPAFFRPFLLGKADRLPTHVA